MTRKPPRPHPPHPTGSWLALSVPRSRQKSLAQGSTDLTSFSPHTSPNGPPQKETSPRRPPRSSPVKKHRSCDQLSEFNRKSERGRSNPVDKESVGDGNVEGRRAADDLDDGLHHQTRKGVDSKNQRVLGVQDPERKMV